MIRGGGEVGREEGKQTMEEYSQRVTMLVFSNNSVTKESKFSAKNKC